jgi:hypothetical protein
MEQTQVTVTFTQKVSEAPYETADYTLSITRSFPDSFGDEEILVEAEGLFKDIKSEVLKQAGQEIDLSEQGVVMRQLKSGVARPDGNQGSPAPQAAPSGFAAAPAPVAAAPAGPTAASAAARPMSGGRVYPRVDFCVGKQADEKQAAWNLLAFHPNEWATDTGNLKVYEVKENAEGTTDLNRNGKHFPNFSVTAEALARVGVSVERNIGIWINDGDSNVPLKVWDQASGAAKADAVSFDWDSRRAELQQFIYQR